MSERPDSHRTSVNLQVSREVWRGTHMAHFSRVSEFCPWDKVPEEDDIINTNYNVPKAVLDLLIT